MTTVTFIGLGTMGAHMVRNLAKAGFTLSLVDVNADIVASLAAETGSRPTMTARDGAGADVVVLMLPNSGIVEAVLGDPIDSESFSAALEPGTVLVDMSSSEPSSTRVLAEKLAKHGVRYVDAPVSGGPGKAATGELTIMAGGDRADVADVRPVLEALGSTIFETGATGSGHAMKSLNNLLSAIGLVGAIEVVATGIKFGLDPYVMLDVINASTGRNQSTEVKFAQQILSGDHAVGFSLELMVKDVVTALSLTQQQGVDSPVSAATVAVCTAALQALRPANPDQAEIATYVGERVGVDFLWPRSV